VQCSSLSACNDLTLITIGTHTHTIDVHYTAYYTLFVSVLTEFYSSAKLISEEVIIISWISDEHSKPIHCTLYSLINNSQY